MADTITSVHNPRVKDASRLRSGRGRTRQGRILIDGLREVQRALQAGVRLHEVFACAAPNDEPTRRELAVWERAGVPVFHVSPSVFSRLAYGDREQGVVAVAQAPERSLEELSVPADALVVVLEGVEKPGNVGAVVRTADAVGASAVLVADGATDLYNPNSIRASLGTVFTVPVCAADSLETLAWLRQHRLQIVATRVDGAAPYTQVSYRAPTAIVLGSEASGLSDVWRGPDVRAVALPMKGRADSLNVATTAAVVLYEALRQRQAAGGESGA